MVDMYVEIETSAYISEILGKDKLERNSVMVIRFDIVLRKVVLHSTLLYFLKPSFIWGEFFYFYFYTNCTYNLTVAVSWTLGAGGGVVLLYASKYDDVKLVVNISGRYDLKIGVEERLGKGYMKRIKKDGFIDVKNRSGNLSIDHAVSIPLRLDEVVREVLTVHGSSETVIPVQDALEFAKIIPNHKLHIIEGANHLYTNHQDELISVVVNFIKENLHQDSGADS
ncbi:uncharacterized protein LOC107641519 [Arachis ipaensis]|uniref:uncharacterized protein LOC107641519 n=1 Tax=Arachis ipaensis TaxID=130454 RepID=UPI000A2B1483|nr:uncharacterized protein LOC107641519 [Arachis ipaensis]